MHPLALFDFAARDELTKERLTAMPHQRVFFKFIHDHPLCCVRMPPGFSKTTCFIWTVLWMLGCDDTSRGAVISATTLIARKPVGSLSAIIETADDHYPELKLAFPDLRPSEHSLEPWSPQHFTVARPPAIRDPSVSAFGVGSASLIGSRLAWMMVDDVLSMENTATREQRDFTKQWLMQIGKSRLDPYDGRMVVTNVPYDPDDLTYYLERSTAQRGPGWPTLSMNAYGRIWIRNAPDWDCDEIRPSSLREGEYRLAAHDVPGLAEEHPLEVAAPYVAPERHAPKVFVDLAERVPLWPERFSAEKLAELEGADEQSIRAHAINFKIDAAEAGERKCKREWVDDCMELAELAGYTQLLTSFEPDDVWFTTTGIDIGGLGAGKRDVTKSDSSCIFTHATLMKTIELVAADGRRLQLRPGTRRVVDVEYGKWSTKTLATKVVQKVRAFKSLARIERNAEEAVEDWTLEIDAAIPVSGHWTGNQKNALVYGVTGIFLAMERKLWLIPSKHKVASSPHLARWVQACLDYESPPAHTDDGIMAAWMSQEEARSTWQPPAVIPSAPDQAALAAELMTIQVR